MPVNKSKIARNAIMLYIRMGIVLVVSLFTARIVLQQLGASDYGLFNVVGGIISLLNFMTGTLGTTVQRFLNVYKAKNDYELMSKVYTASLLIMVLFAVVFLILGESIGIWFLNNKMNIPDSRLIAANWVYQFAIFSTLFSIIAVPYSAMLVAHEDFNIYAYLSIIQACGNLAIAFFIMHSPFDKLIFYSSLICLLHFLYHFSVFIITRIKYRKIRIKKTTESNIYKSLLSFSGWNILGTSMFLVGTQGVNVVLNIFFGTIVNAARGIAVQVSTQVDSFINNIQQATNPQIVQLYSKGELLAVQKLLDDNFRWNFSLFWLMALPIFFEIDYILEIWLGDVPEYTSVFTIIIISRSLLKCFERPINTLNYAVGKVRGLNIFATVSVLSTVCLMCICFYYGWSPIWAFLWDIISIFCCVSFYMWHASRNNAFSIPHFVKKILFPIIMIVFFTITVTFILRKVELVGFIQLLYTLFITTSLTLISLFSILYSKEERMKILSIVMRFKKND